MADANGLNPGDPGYNSSTDPTATQNTPGGSSTVSEATDGTARTAVDNPAAIKQLPTPAPFDNSQGGVQQTQAGYAPVVGANLQTTQAPTASTVFTNGNTGATATYDPTTGMYIDSNGQSIRPDAIRTNNPAAYSGQPATTASGGSSGAAAGGASSDFNNQVQQMILAQLAQAGQPVDPNSPEIAATMSAASDAGNRANDATRTALAERLYAQGSGLNSNALTQQVQQSGESLAANQSNLKASLLTNEYNQKLQTMQSLLSQAVAMGDAQSAQQIQMQIANLQAAVQREGLGINLAEFGANMNEQTALAGLTGA